jgi:hypothetical protein
VANAPANAAGNAANNAANAVNIQGNAAPHQDTMQELSLLWSKPITLKEAIITTKYTTLIKKYEYKKFIKI